ncbi:unnamed protein product, partial [Timema podura]|nr:unnamed protein product [Timema podura]
FRKGIRWTVHLPLKERQKLPRHRTRECLVPAGRRMACPKDGRCKWRPTAGCFSSTTTSEPLRGWTLGREGPVPCLIRTIRPTGVPRMSWARSLKGGRNASILTGGFSLLIT